MSINNNHSFLAFGREVDNSRAWLQSRIFGACGYSSEILLDRLVQRLVEISLQPYAAAVKALCKTATNCFPVPGSQIKCGCASMEVGAGRIIISPRQLLANQLDFFLHWSFCLLAILFVKGAGKGHLPVVLVFGVGEENLFKDGNDEQFVNYCRSGPIEPLRNGKHFFIQSSSKNILSSQVEFMYCKRPLINLLREAKLGFSGRRHLLVNHITLFFSYQYAVFRLPPLSLLCKDFAYSSISFELDRRGLIDSMVLTCSSYTSQPLWVRGLHRSTTHMVWYAQNFRSIVYVADSLESYIPSLRWIRADTHWVWTRAFAKYLGALVHDTTIKAVGPIVWYLPEMKSPQKNMIEIVIFDISPFSDEVALKAGGQITNYNHPDNLFSFINDIISLKHGLESTFHLPISFCLKTKRGYNAIYDRAYFDHIEQLESSDVISLAHHSTNIYSLISSSHLAIVYPYTSPAYIAEVLNVPSIYYDPTRSIVGQHFGDSPSLINFANSPEDLLNAAISALSKVFTNEAMVH